jgi:murein DD-endopeptidase MepM/ murein hydrolase activator NlpD
VVDDVNNSGAQGISLDPSQRTDADREQVKRLAQQFEAMLMTQMLREMRRSMVDADDEDKQNGFGLETMTDTADVEFGAALSRTGGIGLTDNLLKAFERQIAGQRDEATNPATAPTVKAVETSAPSTSAPVLVSEVTAAAPVSSKFGWRQDPITGEARFHQGVDIAVAYGHDVKAAADGVVSFAGVQNGYGNTVVIDHEGGRQTRYAHLSREMVRAGDVVSEGQVLGKSGNSGRTTGPHLHFEMLVNGRPVDPVAAE